MPSRIDDALTYLLAAANGLTATTLADVFIQDGPPTQNILGHRKVLVIGGEWLPSDASRPGASSTQERFVGNASRNESIAISCSAFAQGFDPDMTALRGEAFAIVAALEDHLVANRTMGGLTWGDAMVGSYDAYRPIQNERGAAAIVDFTITATALLWDG